MRNLSSLKLNKEFKRVYYRGKYKAHPVLVTYLLRNGSKINRVGITASKKIGNAVVRNRSRRIIRHAYLNVKENIDNLSGYDIIFVARSKVTNLKSTDVEIVMKKQIEFLIKEFKKR